MDSNFGLTKPGTSKAPLQRGTLHQPSIGVPSTATPPDAPEYITLTSVIALLWRHKARLAISVAAGAILAVALAYSQTRIYQARTSLEIQMPNEDYLGRRQLNPISEPGTIQLEPFLQTQMKLVQSDTLLGRVGQRVDLAQAPDFNPKPGLAAKLRKRLTGDSSTPKPPSAQSIVAGIHNNLTVRLAGQTQVMELLFESSDPKLAAAFVNALAEEYRKESLARIVATTTQTGTLLAGQIAELKSQLQNSEERLQAYVQTNGLVVGDEKESFAETRLRQLQSAMSVAQEARVSDQSKYEMVRSATPDALSKVLESDTLRAYRVKLTELKQKLAEASQVLKPAHYKVRQIQAEIDEVEVAFERERSGILARVRSQYEGSQFREDALKKDYLQQSGQVSSQMGKNVRYSALKRDVEASRVLYDAMMQRVKEAGVASATKASNIRIIDPGVEPEHSIKPNKLLYAIIGLSSGFFYGVVFIFVKDRLKYARPVENVSSGKPTAAMPEVPHLGAIPALVHNLPAGAKQLTARGQQTASTALTIRDKSLPYTGLELSAGRADSNAAKSFGKVLPFLMSGSRHNEKPRVITLTSPCHGEGRTAVACNLAASLAASGQVVLLIDGDRMNPRLHEIFGIPGTHGFSDLMQQSFNGEEARTDHAVWMTDIPGLYVLPAGAVMDRLPTLISQPGVKHVFDQFRRDFDVILIDAPPVLSAGEARELGRLSDGVAMVIRSNWSLPELAATALQQLLNSGVRVIGTITNHCEPELETLAS